MPMIDQVFIIYWLKYTWLLDICLKANEKNCAILWMQGEKDDKIIAVCADDPEYRHYNDIKEFPPHRLAEIRRFFEDCILA